MSGLKEVALYPYRPITINPIWQCLAIVNLFLALATVTATTKRLGVPDEARAALGDWLDVIYGKFLERKFLITSQAMEIVEFAEVVPFGGGVRAARLGFAGAAGMTAFPLTLLVLFGPPILLALFGLAISSLRLLSLFGLPILLLILPMRLLSLFGLPILLLGLLVLFGLLIFPLTFPLRLLVPFGLPILLSLFGLPILLLILPPTCFALTRQPILFRFIPTKLPNRLSLLALTTRLNHFAASSSFLYLNYTLVGGK